MGITILTSCLVVVFATGSIIVFSTLTQRREIAANLEVVAELTGDNCSAALAFNIPEDAERMLFSLRAQHSIALAVIYDLEGNIFATYQRSPEESPASIPENLHEGQRFADGRLYACHPIQVGESTVGTICVVDDLSAWQASLLRSVSVMIGFTLVSFVLAYLLARGLQKVIAGPIGALTATARSVAENEDYSVRAAAGHNDEIGLLTRTFNQMLDGIQEREAKLRNANRALEAEVDERLKAQEQLQNLNATLEEHVEERTRELARSNRELEQFAYVASHDLQEPLRTVASFAGLLKRRYQEKLDEDADEFIDFLVDGATRAQSLINDLLQFSRVGTHGQSFGAVDCEEIFSRVCRNLQVAIEESRANVTHYKLPQVWGDASQLEQLFQNLISNAIKFRDMERRPEIHVGAVDRGTSWEFTVQDNGIGIDPKYYARIFIIFKRLAGRKRAGTGIGLAVCRKIVERHGGEIWVDSEPEKGSIFHFTILKNARA